MSEAVNESEQYVYDISKKTFLSLWSYINPQGKRPGKELCDILIVFGPIVIVVSVKDYRLGKSGDEQVNYKRWIRNSVDESIKQINGAVRFLKRTTHVVDKNGEKGLDLPELQLRKFYRIAVAFGNERKNPMPLSHFEKDSFTHIYDEQSFQLVLQTLDTINDFVHYIEGKEEFLRKSTTLVFRGEENLLAYYLFNNRKFPDCSDFQIIADDLWSEYCENDAIKRKLAEDQVSYVWDHLIESIVSGRFDDKSWIGPGLNESEQAIRKLASENRVYRRILGSALSDFIDASKEKTLSARSILSPSGTAYVFFTYEKDSTLESRGLELKDRCIAIIPNFESASCVVGIGLNRQGEKPDVGYSTTLVIINRKGGVWPSFILEEARLLRKEKGYFRNPSQQHLHEDEYPSAS